MILILYIIVFLIQWAFCFAMTFAYYEKEWAYLYNRSPRDAMASTLGITLLMGLLPIIGPAVVFFNTGFAQHGLKWKI